MNKEWTDVLTLVEEARQALQRIRELHTRDQGYCGACDRLWPCPTVRAMEGDE